MKQLRQCLAHGGLSAKFFSERRKNKKERKKDGQMEEGREKEIGLSLGWPWKQQLPSSPGLGSGIVHPSPLSSQANRRPWPGSSVSKGFPSSLRALCLSGFPMGLRGHGTCCQGYRDVARGRIGGVAGVRESGMQRERNSPPSHI